MEELHYSLDTMSVGNAGTLLDFDIQPTVRIGKNGRVDFWFFRGIEIWHGRSMVGKQTAICRPTKYK